MAQQNSPKQREREATAGLLLGHLVLVLYLKKEMVLYQLKGEVNKTIVKVSKGEVKVIKLTSQGHMAAPNWLLQKAWHASLGDTWHPHTRHAYRDPGNVNCEILPRVLLYF